MKTYEVRMRWDDKQDGKIQDLVCPAIKKNLEATDDG